ncbi:MAG: anti-sigma factor family protein [Armatimonadota bacterium]
MKRLLCRWAEYYLALCEDYSENSLPDWVRRHLRTCPHCQAELQGYRHVHQALRQYARFLPDSPPAGWRPLHPTIGATRRAFPMQVALAAVTVVLAALVGAVVWHSISPTPAGDSGAPTQITQVPPQPHSLPTPSEEERNTSLDKNNPTKQTTPKRIAPPAQPKPSASPSHSPSSPERRPPKRIVVAAHPALPTTPATDTKPAEEPPTETPVPVQPVVVEAHPVASTPVLEDYVMESACPATMGAIE